MESLAAFYTHKFNGIPENLRTTIGQFNVFRIEDRIHLANTSPAFTRRDFYKVMLYVGNNAFHYGDQSIDVNGNTLLFFHPQLPYTYEAMTPDTTGYFCVFKGEFFQENQRLNLNELDLFKPGVVPAFAIDKELHDELESLFLKMIKEQDSDFAYKYELIRNYVSELIYTALKFSPHHKKTSPSDSGTRITTLFLEVLERQFPIEFKGQQPGMRTPKDFASKLSVHVNYLNRMVKTTTGKTTSEHIFERLSTEAKILLKHTSWNIAEVSYALGFEEPAHFNKFFKKLNGVSPKNYRMV